MRNLNRSGTAWYSCQQVGFLTGFGVTWPTHSRGQREEGSEGGHAPTASHRSNGDTKCRQTQHPPRMHRNNELLCMSSTAECNNTGHIHTETVAVVVMVLSKQFAVATQQRKSIASQLKTQLRKTITRLFQSSVPCVLGLKEFAACGREWLSFELDKYRKRGKLGCGYRGVSHGKQVGEHVESLLVKANKKFLHSMQNFESYHKLVTFVSSLNFFTFFCKLEKKHTILIMFIIFRYISDHVYKKIANISSYWPAA